MAKTDNLTDFLADVANAIRTKKGTNYLINPQDFSIEITTIGGDDVDGNANFSKIGYNSDPIKYINDSIDYSVLLLKQWHNGEITSFRNDTNLEYCPMIDTSHLSNTDRMFQGCSNLTIVPLIDTSNVTSAKHMFRECESIKKLPILNFGNLYYANTMFCDCKNLTKVEINFDSVGEASYMFKNCSSLKSSPSLAKIAVAVETFSGCTNLEDVSLVNFETIESGYDVFLGCTMLSSVPRLNLINLRSFSGWFYGCEKVNNLNINFESIKTIGSTSFYGCHKLYKMTIENLGKPQDAEILDFSSAAYWGVGSADSKQTLIDSLITYSYDRASNGMPIATIKLSANTKAVLTESEIAQITAKGFSIS